jgi:hypothetical protein
MEDPLRIFDYERSLDRYRGKILWHRKSLIDYAHLERRYPHAYADFMRQDYGIQEFFESRGLALMFDSTYEKASCVYGVLREGQVFVKEIWVKGCISEMEAVNLGIQLTMQQLEENQNDTHFPNRKAADNAEEQVEELFKLYQKVEKKGRVKDAIRRAAKRKQQRRYKDFDDEII